MKRFSIYSWGSEINSGGFHCIVYLIKSTDHHCVFLILFQSFYMYHNSLLACCWFKCICCLLFVLVAYQYLKYFLKSELNLLYVHFAFFRQSLFKDLKPYTSHKHMYKTIDQHRKSNISLNIDTLLHLNYIQ